MWPTETLTLCSMTPEARSVASGGRPTRTALIRDLVDRQYGNPVRIVAFNTSEGWSRDVTMDIADELRRRYVEFGEVPDSILDFLDANRR
jgi:hypothetical protein